MNDTCLRCKQRAKREKHQFCSDRCTKIAAARAPQLLRVPKGHVMYNDVKRSFGKNWRRRSRQLPKISRIYLITWPAKMRASFERYRENVAKSRNTSKSKEVKRFRSEKRACRLGERGNLKLCRRPNCALCQAIRSGFKTSLERKRWLSMIGSTRNVRFGGGVYLATSSSKAYEYAKNLNNASRFRVVLHCRVVLGRVQKLHWPDHRRLKPDHGFDSIEGMVGSPELVVYDADAVRPAYLILLK